jgi:competence protein ComEC
LANTFLHAERDRWPLWLPVALGAGAGGYFALPVEPSLAIGWTLLGLALTAAGLAALDRARWPLALLAALLLGFGLAKLRENTMATAVLDHPVVAHLTARIVSLEPRERGVRGAGRRALGCAHAGAAPGAGGVTQRWRLSAGRLAQSGIR